MSHDDTTYDVQTPEAETPPEPRFNLPRYYAWVVLAAAALCTLLMYVIFVT